MLGLKTNQHERTTCAKRELEKMSAPGPSSAAALTHESDAGRGDVAMSDAMAGSSQASMPFDSPASPPGPGGGGGSGDFSSIMPPISPSRTATQRSAGQIGMGGPQKRRALGKMTTRSAAMGSFGGSIGHYGDAADFGGDYEDAVGRRIGDEKPLLDERIRERYLRELGDIFAPGR
ncbi:hypothetical protein OC844_002469 [Tilletia horrida]|nr:hypothetical protein OC844_002469 [Tilletia horrida]